MAKKKGEKPIEKIKGVALQAAHAETEPAPAEQALYQIAEQFIAVGARMGAAPFRGGYHDTGIPV